MDEQDILCPLLSEIESSRGYGGSQMDVRFDEIRPATELKGFEEANVDQLQLCSICLGELSEGEVILAETSCSHVFHRRCLYGWLRRAHFCPNCQASFAI
ncbi:OLC1v1009728C1 [Oldenlandia corymbosa var. corymbosa]|uniref:OLC1v1009720C1 n=1 Tax=Oldenlandia corymbosa var. corymbosa TaxID=529605 RepID=A0AAV1DS09_OLDCO|nr:OLC1v1009720C1 [Oldenlandia corymbosa var. corymbosa]CAI9109816.1 OLC1v1009722C1 [Oldenlandia corymbosa var. corymbosa]CAI9109818.1 OLC1v1009724C1 [Oldenlandia corymbosa var. corymbosa]CAI9109820.1 OLC1v1009726C1 [Oldenlandia corymbosa var. corymbosa]CAI9109822.1 OLC1v1009728C1 [Oldenlandia corymbosa var. corymbosa]